ncbi:ABC transporter substrate-binding protein [Gordonia polyisoprenivorans]|uniref:Substrate-binding domain-containing protein n=1 Tax=Gordonia polyisoprenivorans TaxID=84595 RepID=A0A846WFC6_9ACTN|nr:ABC transporter substrate-binding protein [Gordonia polyisoprenivorans]NKY00304.1 substrate-binding domain-containing protein [Gordonia polyisoprenivorans]
MTRQTARRRTQVAAAMILAGALTALLAACGGQSSATPTGQPAGKRVVYIPGLTGNPFYTSVSCGAAQRAQQVGIDYATQGAAEFSVPLQTQIVEAVSASKPAAIMIAVTSPKAMIAPLLQAKRDGIKVITIDGDLTDKSIALTNIESDNYKGGQMAGEKMAQLIGGKGDVVDIDSASGSVVAEARRQGFVDAIAKYPGIHFIGVQYSENSQANAAQIAATLASSNPNLAGIYAQSTNNTAGAITGLREVGKTNKVKLVGFDVSDPIIDALKAGQIEATILQDPISAGRLGIDSAVAAIEGRPVPRDQRPTFAVATPDNLTTPAVASHLYKTHC